MPRPNTKDFGDLDDFSLEFLESIYDSLKDVFRRIPEQETTHSPLDLMDPASADYASMDASDLVALNYIAKELKGPSPESPDSEMAMRTPPKTFTDRQMVVLVKRLSQELTEASVTTNLPKFMFYIVWAMKDAKRLQEAIRARRA